MLAQELFTGVNHPADPDNLTDLEKKHLPVLTVPQSVKAGECFEVSIEVGKLLAHPNEHAHFIEFIELYADDTYLARVDLTAGTTCPSVKLCVALPGCIGELRAYQRCNLHGVWVHTAPIKVTE